jgi:hypothetical protein
MSISKALKLYRSLDKEQKTMVNIKHVSASHTVDEWLNLLKKPALMDRFRDNIGGAMGWRIFGAIVLMIALPIAVSAYMDELFWDLYWDDNSNIYSYTSIPWMLATVIGSAVIGVGLFVWSILLLRKIRGIDLGNHLRLFVVPLLAALKAELKKKQSVEMDINVSAALTNENLVKTLPPKDKNYPQVTTYFYEIPWMYGKTKLLDDTVLEWNITDIVRHRKIKKRSASGKIKFKEKYKVKHVVTVKTSFSKEQYKLLRKPTQDMKFKDSPKSYVFTLKGNAISPDIYSSIPLNRFLDLVSKNYSRVEPIA